MKFGIVTVLFGLLFLGCVSRDGAFYDKNANTSDVNGVVTSSTKDIKASEEVYQKADLENYRYKDVNVKSVDFSKYNRMRTHYFIDYYSKDLNKAQRRRIRNSFRKGLDSDYSRVKFEKTEDDVDHYIFRDSKN